MGENHGQIRYLRGSLAEGAQGHADGEGLDPVYSSTGNNVVLDCFYINCDEINAKYPIDYLKDL